MTFEEVRAKLATATSQLGDLKTELDRKDKLLRAGRDVNGDGTFDDGDKEAVDKVRTRHDAAKKEVKELKRQVEDIEANVETIPTQHIELECPQ